MDEFSRAYEWGIALGGGDGFEPVFFDEMVANNERFKAAAPDGRDTRPQPADE